MRRSGVRSPLCPQTKFTLMINSINAMKKIQPPRNIAEMVKFITPIKSEYFGTFEVPCINVDTISHYCYDKSYDKKIVTFIDGSTLEMTHTGLSNSVILEVKNNSIETILEN